MSIPDSLALAISDLVLVRPIGRGGCAEVVAARDAAGRDAAGRDVAVKIGLMSGPDVRARFAREARVLTRVGPPTTPALYGEGTTSDGRPYLVMELLHGRSLASRLAAEGALALADALAIFSPLCTAVARVHAEGVVHRDLKPQNVLFRDHGLALIDFGLARSRGDAKDSEDTPALTRTGDRLGTALYMAPEQCLAAPNIDERADIYALAIILFEMLAGRPPFVGESALVHQAHVLMRAPRLSELAPVPLALDDVIAGALAKDPAQRPSSALALEGAVRRAASGKPAEVMAARHAESAGRTRGAASAQRTVALLAFRAQVPIPSVKEFITKDGGQIELARADRYVVAFPGEVMGDQAVRLALRVGERLLSRLAAEDLVVHAAELRVREARGGLTLRGAALSHPDAWWSSRSGGRNVALTSEAAALVDATESQAPAREQAHSAEKASTGLHGRDRLVTEIVSDALSSLPEKRPSLCTIFADTGLGKTSALRAVHEALGRASVRSLWISSAAENEPDAPLREMLRFCLGPDPGTPATGDGPPQGIAAWPLVALLFGQISEGDPTVAPLLRVPGAFRVNLAKIAGEALRSAAASAPLVVLVDDLHRASQATLDALELATLEGTHVPIWIGGSAAPSLRSFRPTWGHRAARATTHELPPLGDDAARSLLLDLLHPAEHVPEALLLRLIDMAQGVPMDLVELAAVLTADGGLTRRPGADGWKIAAGRLLETAPVSIAERLAERALEQVPSALRSLAHLCATLGDQPTVQEVAAILSFLGDPLDARAGLERLCAHLVLRPLGGEQFKFRHPMMRSAIFSRIPAAERQRYQRAAFESLRAMGKTVSAAYAHHAVACGARDEAVTSFLTVAKDDLRRHRYSDAEGHFSAALAVPPDENDGRRLEALSGRGKVRYRLERYEDALFDLRAALALAESSGNATATCDLLLEQAEVLDWMQDFATAAALAERVLPMAQAMGDPALLARSQVALGRACFRKEDLAASISFLSEGVQAAQKAGEYEARLVGLLVLAPLLVYAGRIDEAKTRFEEVIAACQEVGDLFHLGVAHSNRLVLWIKLQERDRGASDLRTAIAVARDLGNVQLERVANFNLAELLYLGDDLDAALPLALRAKDLQLRFFPGNPMPDDSLLLARIASARGDAATASAQLDWIDQNCPDSAVGASYRTLIRLVELRLMGNKASPDDWQALVEQARASSLLAELEEVMRAIPFDLD